MSDLAIYLEWVKNIERKGIVLTEYPCPDCNCNLKTPTPAEGDIYDSMTTCPYCDEHHFKSVNSDGSVDVT